MLEVHRRPLRMCIPYDRYELLTQLHGDGAIIEQRDEEDGVHVVANVPDRLMGRCADFAV
jgi:hypothetical protein